MFQITAFSNSHGKRYTKAFFQDLVKGVDGVLGMQKGNLGVHLVTNPEIQRLNKHYRGKDMPTDVLSFAYHDGAKMPGSELFGEIFLAPDVIDKKAPESGNTFEEELRFIFIHGVLHLLGYDHEQPEEEREMNWLTGRILGN